MLFKLVYLYLSMQSTWFVVFVMKMLLMWLLVANLFFEVHSQENYKVLVSKDHVFFDVDNTIVIHCGDCCWCY